MTNELAATAPVVDSLVQFTYLLHGELTRACAENEVSVTQLRLLGILRDRTPTMAALADRLGLDRSSVSGLIDRAERRGLVARRTSTDDARVTLIDLTDAGQQLVASLASTVSTRIEALLQPVSAGDRDSLQRITDAVVDSPRD